MKLRLLFVLVGIMLFSSLNVSDSACKTRKICLSKQNVKITVGKKVKLKVKNSKKKVKWTSQNKGIAKVSQKGVVKGVKAGRTKIKAKIGRKKLVCKVTVKEKPEKIVYKNTVFGKQTYKNIKYITCELLYGAKKISSSKGIAAIYRVLAGINPIKEVTGAKPTPPAGGTVIELVMKDGTVERVNVSGKIYFRDKCYELQKSVSGKVGDLARKYMKQSR